MYNLWQNLIISFSFDYKGVNITEISGRRTLVTSNYGVTVVWNNVYNVRVKVLGRYLNKTSGLCGTFNRMAGDDFLTSTNTTETNVTTFGNSWKTEPSCDDATTVEHPCVTNAERKPIAENNCSALLRYPFWSCNETVNATDGYVENCEYDVCACENNPIACLCESFQAYAAECESRGVTINWRNEFEQCSKFFTITCSVKRAIKILKHWQLSIFFNLNWIPRRSICGNENVVTELLPSYFLFDSIKSS